MSIQSYITELEAINAEIKRNNDTNRKLRSRATILEQSITGYLDSNNKEGVKYRGKRFVLEEKVSHKRRGKKDKEADTLRLLSDLGISNTRDAYTRLMNAQKGEEIETRKLKIHKDVKKKDTY
jgi:hypothetical protein